RRDKHHHQGTKAGLAVALLHPSTDPPAIRRIAPDDGRCPRPVQRVVSLRQVDGALRVAVRRRGVEGEVELAIELVEQRLRSALQRVALAATLPACRVAKDAHLVLAVADRPRHPFDTRPPARPSSARRVRARAARPRRGSTSRGWPRARTADPAPPRAPRRGCPATPRCGRAGRPRSAPTRARACRCTRRCRRHGARGPKSRVPRAASRAARAPPRGSRRGRSWASSSYRVVYRTLSPVHAGRLPRAAADRHKIFHARCRATFFGAHELAAISWS